MSLVVNLDKHAVLEASAGAGKTYTLEQLVLRLLIEREIRLDQVLLVTYTEKATGELKGRLRDRLMKALADPAHADKRAQLLLRNALDQFDQTAIFTIHGFCQRVLQEFAFEQSQDFRPRLVNDRPLLKSCLREIQRRDWHGYGAELRLVLEAANYQGKSGKTWEKRVLDIAGRMRPGCGHRLAPAPDGDWLKTLPVLESNVRDGVRWLRELAGGVAEPVEQHRWHIGYSQLPGAKAKKCVGELLTPTLRWLASAETDAHPLASFLKLVRSLRNGFHYAVTCLTQAAAKQFDTLCPNLGVALENADTLRAQLNGSLQTNQLAAQTILQLQERLAEIKRERGLQSFEDMIARVAQGLDPDLNAKANDLVLQLRERYRYAIVDEFQDTDPLQWRIFRRIFVEGGDARLFVVGDPKQAIFGFRGADLPTYLTAVTQLRSEHDAEVHELATNWRSTPELLDTLNQLFEGGRWFADCQGLSYTRVAPPPENLRTVKVLRDDSDRAPLTIIDLPTERLTQARRQFAQFIAGEVSRLLRGPAIEFMHKTGRRTLDARDICILVYKRSEAAPIIDALRTARIPFSFYKQSGLWQSEQAVHLGYVLRAIARPEDADALHKALLTCFIRLAPETLAASDGWTGHEQVHELFQGWISFAERRQWGRLFQSLFEDTGLIYHEAARPDGERRLANFRHIFATLEQAAYAQNFDLFELLELFEQKRTQVEDEAELQPIETEQPKVQIMTIHAAKGLEFPVVFLAGGFTQKMPQNFVSYRDDQGNVIFDLAADTEAKTRAKNDRQAEDRRLLYVALTRAMIKLYLPRPQGPGSSPGPIMTILKPALETACLVPAPGGEGRGKELVSGDAIPSPSTPRGAFPKLDDPLFPKIDADLWRRRILMRSFSSLHREKLRHAEVASYGEEPRREADDEPATPTAADALRGPVFGDIVHNVLEQLDFSLARQAAEPAALIQPGHPFRILLDDELRKNVLGLRTRITRAAVEDACRQLVADMCWKTLRTPLAALGGALCDVPKKDLLAEVEFHFPEAFVDERPAHRHEEGFLTGFMDLVIRRHDRYFLLDWKTNLLPGYTSEEVSLSMSECDYTRQYRLYVHALSRWLGRLQGGFDCERDFGGVYYLYLRGMNGLDESSGVFFSRPRREELALATILE